MSQRVYRPGARVVFVRQHPYQLRGMRRDEWLAVHVGETGEVIEQIPGGACWVLMPDGRRVLPPADRIERDRAPRAGTVRP